MTFLLFPAFFLLAFTRADNLDGICSTVFTSLMCVCENREDIIFSPVYDEEITQVTIKGCGKVELPFSAFSNLPLEELEFNDIDSLLFSEFSISSVRGLMSLKIQNIVKLIVDKHAFTGLDNVDYFLLNNVTVDVLPQDAFSPISNINFMLIANSSFHVIEQLAFDLRNVTIFHVSDSQFDLVKNSSFLILQSNIVLFENCYFSKTSDITFTISLVDVLSFLGCTFGSLATTFIRTKEVQTFTLENSTIEVLKPDAFVSVEVQQKFSFANNTIQITYPSSLTPFVSQKKNYDVEYCCNYFSCDCNLYWIWESEDLPNPSFLKNSLCLQDRTKDLSLYVPILDSYNNCIALQFTSQSSYDSTMSKLPIKLGGINHAPIESLSIALKIIVCCLIITELTSNKWMFH